jgi:hypothetical protein
MEETTAARIAALESDLAAAHAELASLQDQHEALRSEYMLVNEELADRTTDLHRLRSENAAAHEAAAEELAALRTELERLSAARTGNPYLLPVADDPLAAAIRELASPSPLADSGASPREPEEDLVRHEPTPFHHDTTLTAIPCGSTDDVIELRVSYNTIRISCDGANAQNCSAYICGLERNGSKQIYVALYQTETKKAQIYVPAHQPHDADDYDRVMEDAISFTDVVGFIINLQYLGAGPAERAKALQQIPVLASP